MAAIRRRNKWDRARDRKRRPRTAAPTEGWLIGELAKMTQVSVRTLRRYVSLGVMTPLERRGTATRYARRELLRLLALLRRRQETNHSVVEIRRQLDGIDDAALEAWLRQGSLTPPVAAALGGVGEPTVLAASPELEPERSLEPWRPQLQTWQRVQLLPGLELLIGPNASPAATRAAAAICREHLK